MPAEGIIKPAGLFHSWQPEYARRGIATFPVRIFRDNDGKAAKVPMVSNWQRMGLPASRSIAKRPKMAGATAFGFVAGKRSRITALDIDTTDERILAEALDTYGKTPVVTRSGGSGNFQAWYCFNGEGRKVRQLGDKPIDVLGSGVVVAPPSQGLVRTYEFIEGGLDDIERLPKLANLPEDFYARKSPEIPAAHESHESQVVYEGGRNNTLFDYLIRQARHCDNFDALLDLARTRNAGFIPPMADTEVMRVAQSVWGIEQRGENRCTTRRSSPWQLLVSRLAVKSADALALVTFLKENNGRDSVFMIADALSLVH
jgi:hypothetical protein